MPSLLVVTPPGAESDSLCARLGEAGFTVWAAGTGAEAVGAARRRRPDVILMDPALSAMDRWHAVKRLNTDAGTSAIPVLTLASDATSPAGLQRVVGKVHRTLNAKNSPALSEESVPPVVRRSMPPQKPAGVSPGIPPIRAEEDVIQTPPPVQEEPPPRPPAPQETVDLLSAEPIQVNASVQVDASEQVKSAAAPVEPVEDIAPSTPPQPKQAAVVAARPVRKKALGNARILVVDDNALNRDMLSRRLSRRGYTVSTADDGQQALDAIAAEAFDLVLLDWMMPGLSGIDVLRKVREDHGPMDLPIIMATAKTEAEDIVEALRLEANDYVTKPLNFDVVNARIRTQLGLVEAHRKLRASEHRFRALLENTGDMIIQYTPDGAIQYVSPASRILLGYEPADMQRQSLYDWIHPIDRRELESQQASRVTLPPAYTFIARMQRQDGTYIWVETSCRVTQGGGGDTVIQAACRDVTEHMDRLAGDEPPLPLGGDIMDHPGWRGGKAVAPASPSGGSAGSGGPTPVVLLTLLDGVDLKTVDSAAQQILVEALATKLKALAGEGDA